jgi:PST family polysaccharide transporter
MTQKHTNNGAGGTTLLQHATNEPVATARFRTDHLGADLKRHATRGVAATFLAQICRFVLRLLTSVVIARLLLPEDYGLVGMVTALLGFALLFSDFGLSMATVQKPETTHEEVNCLFWINLSVGAGLTLLTVAFAPVIARFYHEPRLTLVAIALSGTFLLAGLTIQHQALLKRQMCFGRLAAIEMASLFVTIPTGVLLAWRGAGYWTLIVMQMAAAFINVVGTWLACDWRPGRPRWHAATGNSLRFGGNLLGFNLLNFLARNLDNVLIGRFWGAFELGLYAKSYSLLLMPLQQINAPLANVATPTLSRLQNDPARYRKYYCTAVAIVAYLTYPPMILAAVLADILVPLLLGPQWTGAVTLFRIFALVALLQAVMNPTGFLFISLGRTDRLRRWGLFAIPLIVASFAVGLPWGAFGVAIAYALSMLVLTVPCLLFALKDTPITLRDLCGSLCCPVVLALVTTSGAALARGLCFSSGPYLTLFTCVGGSALAWITTVSVWRRAHKEIAGLIDLVRSIGPANHYSP